MSGGDNFQGNTLASDRGTRAERVRAGETVRRIMPKGPGRTEVLRALFAEGCPQLPAHGAVPSLAWKEARKAWLARVRRWVVKQGRHPASTQVTEADQRAYEAATGDSWRAIEEGLR